jgi:2-methylcitrate dehydratase PrpD
VTRAVAHPLSEPLAAFAAELPAERIPAEVIGHAKLLLLDLLGAALAGVDTDEGRAVRAAARWFGGESGPAAIWGTPGRTTRAAAALVNGTTAHAQELDDFGGCDHSGAVVVPAVLACADGEPGVTGPRVLEALVVGYDVALRVRRRRAATGPTTDEAGTPPARAAASGRPPPPPGSWGSTAPGPRGRSASRGPPPAAPGPSWPTAR